MGFDDVSAISVEPVSLLTPTNTITDGQELSSDGSSVLGLALSAAW